MSNLTVASTSDLPPLPPYDLHPLPPLVPGIPDKYFTLILLILAYWTASLFFLCIDHWDLFPQYRLHTPAEVLKRNLVSRRDVFRDVVLQQVVQTIFGVGLGLLEPDPLYGKESYDIALWAQRIRLAQRAIPAVLGTVGVDAARLATSLAGSHAMLAGALSGGQYPSLTQAITLQGAASAASVPAFAAWELLAAKTLYHIGVPAAQFLLAVCVLDTWQYFVHRGMHMNRYLYTLHSRHHRLYVPYAYGAMYNHPAEGFVMDTLGAGIAYLASGMSARQSMWFFAGTAIKTVDDHCGYAFPWDPLQRLTGNNAGYHDVHHQTWGIKTNFSQPFSTFWDSALGTKWTGEDVSARYERARAAAEKKGCAQQGAVTSSAPSLAGPDAHVAAFQAASPAAQTAPAQPGTPQRQAAASRQQIFDAGPGDGAAVLARETAEERRAAVEVAARQSPRKRSAKSLKGLTGLISSLHGRGSSVLGLESGR